MSAVEISLIFGETQGASCLPALPRRIACKRLVGGVVVAVKEVAKSKGQGVTIRIDLEAAVQRSEQLLVCGAVKALYRTVPLGVSGRAMDQPSSQSSLHHSECVVGSEARAFVQVEQIHQPVLADHLVESVQEQLHRLRSAYQPIEPVAGGIVEEEQCYPAQARVTGSKVFAVSEHTLHAVWVTPSAHVALAFGRTSAGGQSHSPASPPCSAPVDRQILGDDAKNPGPPEQLGHRGSWITVFLFAKEGDQRLAECLRGFGPLAAPWYEGFEPSGRVRGSPALQGAHAQSHRATVGVGVFLPGDLTHCITRRGTAQNKRLELGKYRVTHQSFGGDR